MDSAKKKELKNQYANREVIGGVYCLKCSGNNRTLIRSTLDLKSIQNRYEFSIMIKGCPDPAFRSELTQYGSESFSMTILEQITKKEDQTNKEFADDVKVLYEMWLEKFKQEGSKAD